MLSAFVSGFVLFLREGLEACLIVSILLAALRQLGETRHIRAVWIGVSAALVCSLAGAALIFRAVTQYDGSHFQEVFETITYLVAVVLLTSMTFWMQLHSRSLKNEIIARASTAGSGLAFGLLAFSTVGREGLETAVFALAFAFKDGEMLLLGGALGIVAAIVLCFMIYRLGYKLDFRVFFRIMGIILLFFAAGLLGDAIQNLQQLGWITFGSSRLWNTTSILSEDSMIGDILHTFLGYAESPTALQVVVYLAFLLATATIFWNLTRRGRAVPPTAATPSRAISPYQQPS
ncbi:MAG: FTR1 family protein [Ktedonobacterales bacterium]